MKFPHVQEVQEVSSAEGANALLKLGWRLLEILPSRNPRHTAIYILGARTHTLDPADFPALPATRRKR